MRFIEHARIKAFHLDPSLLQLTLNFLIKVNSSRLIAPIPENTFDIEVINHLHQSYF